jgi:hypothetical protein
MSVGASAIVCVLLRREGFTVNHKRLFRLYREVRLNGPPAGRPQAGFGHVGADAGSAMAEPTAGRSTSSPISSSTVAACASWPWSRTARANAWRWCRLCRVLHRPFAGRVVLNETLFRSLPHPRGARRLARGLQSPAASIAARLAKPRHLRCAPPTAPLRGPPPHPPMKVKPAARLRSPLDKSSGQTQRSRVRPPGTHTMSFCTCQGR